MKHIRIGDIQKAEKEDEMRFESNKEQRRKMFESFKKHGICPDYDAEKCTSKLGVYCCWGTEEHRKYRCPTIDYSGD